MKRNIPLFIAVSVVLLSCSPLLLEPMEPKVNCGEPGSPMTRAIVEEPQQDQSAITHFFQTDHKFILIHHVEFRDSAYVQTLTPEDMVSLGITEEDQAFSDTYVVQLNELNKQQ